MIRSFVNSLDNFDAFLCQKIFILTGKKNIDSFMYWISRTGDGYLYLLLGIILSFIDFRYSFKVFMAGIVAFVIQMLVQKSIKNLVKRERPGGKVPGIRFLMNPPDKFSFPSGHTAGAFLLVTILTSCYAIYSFPLYLWASLVGFSRVYNGVHYPLDIIIGSILGILAAHVGMIVIL